MIMTEDLGESVVLPQLRTEPEAGIGVLWDRSSDRNKDVQMSRSDGRE